MKVKTTKTSIEIKVDTKKDVARLGVREPEIGKNEKTIIEIEEVQL